MEHTFGINEIEFNGRVAHLLRDGVEQYCPFAVKNNFGEKVRCGNWCPHFKLRRYNDKMILTLTCVNGAPTMTIEQEVAP